MGKIQVEKSEDVKADENVTFIRGLLDQAGHIGRGPGYECIGYAVAFVYRNTFSVSGVAEVRCHSELKIVPEELAGQAVKTLAEHMMKKYGRRPQRKGAQTNGG